MASTKDILGNLVKVEGISAAVVVGRDGFVIESAGSKIDVEAVGAVISSGYGSTEIMGNELGIGKLDQIIGEYDSGILMIVSIGPDVILVVVTSKSAMVGNIRYNVKKYIQELELSL